ncbi:MAG: hypothetical protein ACREHG_08190 [Candidatus Saccharimonadales bacterium]
MADFLSNPFEFGDRVENLIKRGGVSVMANSFFCVRFLFWFCEVGVIHKDKLLGAMVSSRLFMRYDVTRGMLRKRVSDMVRVGYMEWRGDDIAITTKGMGLVFKVKNIARDIYYAEG